MKKLILVLSIALAMASCKEDNVRVQSYNPQVTVTPTANVGDNLNLEALGDLVKTSNSAQEIEDRLNSESSINNLDLDGDGQVDYIKVSEYGSGNDRGFSFVVPTADNDVLEVAKVSVNPSGEIYVTGNRSYYGDNYYHRAHYSASDMMIMAYLMSNHRPYYSPYHHGYYPSTYRSYRSQPVSTYRTRVTTTTRTSRPASSYTSNSSTRAVAPSSYTNTSRASSVSAPVSARAANVSTPTSSQKSFNVTSQAKSRPVTTGFGNKTTTTRPTATTSRSSSGFGSSSKSSSRPSSSSSYSSRPSRSSSSSYSSSSSSRRSSSSFGSSSRSSSRRR